MNKVETICPHCKTTNSVEKSSSEIDRYAMQDIKCAHCSKSWQEDLSDSNRLAKSFQPTSLAELRTNLKAQLDELLKQINALQDRRAAAASRAAKFNTNGREVEKSDEINREFLNKALDNGTPVTFQPSGSSAPRFQTVESVGSGQRVRSGAPFDVNGVEKSDTADAELRKALAAGKPVGR